MNGIGVDEPCLVFKGARCVTRVGGGGSRPLDHSTRRTGDEWSSGFRGEGPPLPPLTISELHIVGFIFVQTIDALRNFLCVPLSLIPGTVLVDYHPLSPQARQ